MRRTRQLAGLLLALVILVAALALYAASRTHRLASAQAFFRKPQPQLQHVSFNLLPDSVTVNEGADYSHQFSIPGDATNGLLAGEFEVEPFAGAQMNMLVVSAAGFSHWRQYLSSTQPGPGDRDLLYRTGNTRADLFEIKLSPGTYHLVFDYGPPTGPTFSDHGGILGGLSSRYANTKITLSYDLPQEIR